VRAQVSLDAGPRGNERFHHVQLSHHRRREHRRPCAVRQQELGDRLVAGMGRGIDARFPIAEAPVDRGAREGRLTLDQFLHALEVAVRDADDLSHQRRILRWKHIARKRRGRDRRLSPGLSGRQGDAERREARCQPEKCTTRPPLLRHEIHPPPAVIARKPLAGKPGFFEALTVRP
jgi:hypothetical protein